MYHFALNDGIAVFATHTVKKEIEFDGVKKIHTIPAFSLEEAVAIDGFDISEQHIPIEILEKAKRLSGITSSKEIFEQMLYNSNDDINTAERLNLLENAFNAMLGGDINV